MKLLLRIYKEEFLLLSLFLSLFLWALSSTFLSFGEDKVLILTHHKGIFKVLDSKEETPLEIENFIRHFLGLSLNFNPSSFSKNISKAGDLMSDSLWALKRKEFLEMRDYVLSQKILQTAEILEIGRSGAFLFKVKVEIHNFKKGEAEVFKKEFEIKLSKNERNEINPWGYNVEDITTH